MGVDFRSRDGVMVLRFWGILGHRCYIDCEENLFGNGNIFFFGRRQSSAIPSIANTTSWFSDMTSRETKGTLHQPPPDYLELRIPHTPYNNKRTANIEPFFHQREIIKPT